MAKCKACKCKKCNMTAENNSQYPWGCYDVCKHPICGNPIQLSIFAPVIYDEIGVNLCASFTLGVNVATEYPTAVSACAQVVSVAYANGAAGATITRLNARPNCYQVTLTEITVTFNVTVYDANCNALGSFPTTAVYRPTAGATAPTYDEDTNPSSVSLEIFAPYGTAFTIPTPGANPEMVLNNVSMLDTANFVRQGINLYTIPKVVGLDIPSNTISVGLSLILQSLYFAGYRVPNRGKINTPKGSLVPEDDSNCIEFVEGDLLDLAIKPLFLGPPACEEKLKKDCDGESPCCACDDNCPKKPKCEEDDDCFDLAEDEIEEEF